MRKAPSATSVSTAATPYEATAPAKPYSSPPRAGPITDAVCHVLLRQAMAFRYMARGMMSAPSA